MKKIIRLSESDLHNIVKRVLDEMAGYQDTMNKAQQKFNPNTWRGKVSRTMNPDKAAQYDRLHRNGRQEYNSAMNDEVDNYISNFPNAADPYQRPDMAALERRNKNNAKIAKYGN